MDDDDSSQTMLLIGGSVVVATLGVAFAVSKLSLGSEKPARHSGGAKKSKAKKSKKKAKSTDSTKVVVKKSPEPEVVAAAPAPAPAPVPTPAAPQPGSTPVSPSKKKKKKKKKVTAPGGGGGASAAAAAMAVPEGGASVEEKREQRALAKVQKEMAKAAAGDEAAEDGWSVAKKAKKPKKVRKPVVEAKEAGEGAEVTKSVAEVVVSGRAVGIVIGPKGSTLHAVQDATGTRIELPQRGESGQRSEGPVKVTITGPAEGVARARAAIEELAAKGYCRLTGGDDFREKKLSVDQDVAAELLRERAARLNKLQDATGIRVNVGQRSSDGSTRDVAVMLAGPKEGVEKAHAAVLEIARFGHSELTHPGMVHAELAVPSEMFRRVIGAGGSEIKHIQNAFRCRVNMPGPHSLSDNVIIVGSPEGVTSAEKHIKKIIADVEQERAGAVPDELDADEWGAQEGHEAWMDDYAPPPR